MIAAALVLFSTLPLMAQGWTWVRREALSYLMPPIACRIGPLPPFLVQVVPQTDLDRNQGIPTQGRLLAIHGTVDDTAVIYISAALPHRPPIFQDTLIHEEAHLRGCEHGELH